MEQVGTIIDQEIQAVSHRPDWQHVTPQVLGPVTVNGQLYYRLLVTADTAVVATLASELLNNCLTALNEAAIPFAPQVSANPSAPQS